MYTAMPWNFPQFFLIATLDDEDDDGRAVRNFVIWKYQPLQKDVSSQAPPHYLRCALPQACEMFAAPCAR